MVPRVIIKIGFLGGMGPDIFPLWMGEHLGFICKRGKQLPGAQVGSRQVPFSLEALCPLCVENFLVSTYTLCSTLPEILTLWSYLHGFADL